jgi:hypothetical protein
MNKTEGPSTVINFLGILIDTELWIPLDKLTRLQGLLGKWSRRKTASRKDLEFLLGHLCHAATVIQAGRPFLHQLFSPLAVSRRTQHVVSLDSGARADLAWWRCFLKDWNRTSSFPPLTPSFKVVCDASGSFRCGVFPQNFGRLATDWHLLQGACANRDGGSSLGSPLETVLHPL